METEAPESKPTDPNEALNRLTQVLDRMFNPEGEARIGFGCFIFNLQETKNVTVIGNAELSAIANIVKPWIRKMEMKQRTKERRNPGVKRVK